MGTNSRWLAYLSAAEFHIPTPLVFYGRNSTPRIFGRSVGRLRQTGSKRELAGKDKRRQPLYVPPDLRSRSLLFDAIGYPQTLLTRRKTGLSYSCRSEMVPANGKLRPLRRNQAGQRLISVAKCGHGGRIADAHQVYAPWERSDGATLTHRERSYHVGLEWPAAIAVSSLRVHTSRCSRPKVLPRRGESRQVSVQYVVLRPLSACQATRQCSETGRYPNG